jgi:hypothetical protein
LELNLSQPGVVPKMAANSQTFESLLLGSIDEALLSLGESSRQSIYFHIQKNFEIDKKEIPTRLQEFQEGLEKIFGVGARFIEILIMKNLYAKLGRPFTMDKKDQLEFIKYVNAARESYLKGCSGADCC